MKNPVNDVFPRRLRQARMMRRLSLEKLAVAMQPSVSRQAINKYEKGLMMPDSAVLIALAKALGMKVDYFFRPFTVDIDTVEFRRNSCFTEKMAVVLKERVSEELERYIEIEQLSGADIKCGLPHRVVATEEEAREFALEIRGLLGLGNDGISNVTEVLEENGIKIIEVEESSDFAGLAGYANGDIPLIVLNAHCESERKRFTAMHELGHLLLEIPDDRAGKSTERICNAFASEMLLPSGVLKAKMGLVRHDISLTELVDIQRQFGISIDDIMESMRSQGIITDRRYQFYQKKKNSIPEFQKLVEKSRSGEERSGRFIRMVYRALADEIISFSKAAVLLNTSIYTIKSNLLLV